MQHAAEIHGTVIEDIFLDLMAVEGGIENTELREISVWASEGKKIVVVFNSLQALFCHYSWRHHCRGLYPPYFYPQPSGDMPDYIYTGI